MSFVKKSVLLGTTSLCFSMQIFAQELKECQNDQDKMKGCVVKEYYPNGNLQVITPYKNGKEDGDAKDYYENGIYMGERPYKNGKREGVEKHYHPDGTLWHVLPYKNGKREGVEKIYHENGKLHYEITYQNDKAISGKCGDGKEFTNTHLHHLEHEHDVPCK